MRNDYFLELFCRNVARIRRERGLTKADMARLMGVSVNTLGKIERDIIPPRLSVDVIFYIQENFGISPSNLFLP